MTIIIQKKKLFQFLLKTNWILPKKFRQAPIPQSFRVFTDGSNNGKEVTVSKKKGHQLIHTNCISTQKAELVAVLTVLQTFSDPLNIVSDSAYIVDRVQSIETASLSNNPNQSL